MPVTVILHDDLAELTASQRRMPRPLVLYLTRRTSVKDFIEAQGVPHTEIHRLIINGDEVDFSAIVADHDRIEAFGPPVPVDLTLPTRLRPKPLTSLRFATDANVGRLAGLLRLAGFDTFYDRDLPDQELAALVDRERRLLLTRDLGLLKRKGVEFGRLIRAALPYQQLREIVELYGLAGSIRPLRRCLHCNEILQPVAKKEIIDRLEPLTKKYYDDFKVCPGCNRIYWAGSHQEKILKNLEKLHL
jgi:uncharacterized protein with PIN domain